MNVDIKRNELKRKHDEMQGGQPGLFVTLCKEKRREWRERLNAFASTWQKNKHVCVALF